MELQCDGTRDNSYAARTSKSRISLTCMVLSSRAEYMRAKRPCQGAAITRSTSIDNRIDTEFKHFRHGAGDDNSACAAYPFCIYAAPPAPGKKSSRGGATTSMTSVSSTNQAPCATP